MSSLVNTPGGDDEFLVFADQAELPESSESSGPPLVVAIIDDDADVHAVTKVVLNGFGYRGRPLQFLEAYSAAEGRALFDQHRDIAVALVDVIMEDDKAGLSLVDYVRNALGNTRVRLILRTGQPSNISEMELIKRYDINDYREKNSLDWSQMVIALTVALRGFEQIDQLQREQARMLRLIASLGDLFDSRTLEQRAQAVISQLPALLPFDPTGLICFAGADDGTVAVVAANGQFAGRVGMAAQAIDAPEISSLVAQSFDSGRTEISDAGAVVYVDVSRSLGLGYFIPAPPEGLDDTTLQLLIVFARNVAPAFLR